MTPEEIEKLKQELYGVVAQQFQIPKDKLNGNVKPFNPRALNVLPNSRAIK